jgi:3-isopropylmalate/(R)-2-methylmalate dehydratase large subunit
MLERGLVLPGQLVVGADSHSTIYGAMNAVGIPINRTEMAGIWATGEIWLRVPQSIRVEISGALGQGVYAKDVCLKILSLLGADGATYRCLEFAGSGISRLSMSERMTLCNMAVEAGAKAGIMPFDTSTRDYLVGRTEESYEPFFPDRAADYERCIEIDMSQLQPQVACPHRVDNIKDLLAVAGKQIQHGYLGSCTNGRLDDLRIAADILDGRKIANGVHLAVYPASEEVRKAAQAEGILDRLSQSGAKIEASACGSCFGAIGAILKPGDVCISSSNRNFCGRMGSREAEIYLSSPAVVAASCLKGEIADPRDMMQ